ncbi:AraC family transcriptional regulator [Streptomyces sp. NPDC089424]|uniref:AraC family transcriptional regulator n=1 Tax=Streptomyces sp. NPDC089424 TaxID=3365917 RepID=UPI0038074169
MDALSRLIRLARLQGHIDVRCLLAGRYTLDNDAAEEGRAPFHLLLRGACDLELPDRVIELVSGDMVLLPRGTAHRMHVRGRRAAVGVERRETGPYELIGNATAEDADHATDAARGGEEAPVDLFCGHYLWEPGPAQILMDMLPEVVHVPLGATARVDPPSAGRLGPIGPLSEFMRGEARHADPGVDAILNALCDVLLTMALRGTRGLGQAVWLASAEESVRTVTEAVLRDPSYDWSIEKFAALGSMSRATFIRHFTRETGMNPGDFLTRLRMLLAADLLANTDRPVGSIATAVGYASGSAFGRAFRLATGSAPGQLRSKGREQRHRDSRLAGEPLPAGAGQLPGRDRR